jgi:hypothetical protein
MAEGIPHYAALLADEWKSVRLVNNIERQIYIKVWPVEVRAVRYLEIADLLNGSLFEPGEVSVL